MGVCRDYQALIRTALGCYAPRIVVLCFECRGRGQTSPAKLSNFGLVSVVIALLRRAPTNSCLHNYPRGLPRHFTHHLLSAKLQLNSFFDTAVRRCELHPCGTQLSLSQHRHCLYINKLAFQARHTPVSHVHPFYMRSQTATTTLLIQTLTSALVP
jgi:hypothetical protein